MGKKCKCPPVGAPEWVLTYGDMMSLLLTFFILLAALSEIKKEDVYQNIVAEVQKAFGMRGGGGKIPGNEDPALTLIKRLEQLERKQQKQPLLSNAMDPGVDGREPKVTRVREGDQFVIGGRITFEPGSAELSYQARQQLARVANLIRGYNNKIELRGHAASMELAMGSQYGDLWTLSYARGKAVMDFLTSEQMGIRKERIRVIANADQEPLVVRVYTPAEQVENRRVEVVATEILVDDMTEPEPPATR